MNRSSFDSLQESLLDFEKWDQRKINAVRWKQGNLKLNGLSRDSRQRDQYLTSSALELNAVLDEILLYHFYW